MYLDAPNQYTHLALYGTQIRLPTFPESRFYCRPVPFAGAQPDPTRPAVRLRCNAPNCGPTRPTRPFAVFLPPTSYWLTRGATLDFSCCSLIFRCSMSPLIHTPPYIYGCPSEVWGARPTRADPPLHPSPMNHRVCGCWGARRTRADPLIWLLAHQVWCRPRAQRAGRPTDSPVSHSSKGDHRGINS